MSLTDKILQEANEKPTPIGIYFNWSCNALLGLNPVSTDSYLRQNLDIIKQVARGLLSKINYTPKELYRGVILQYKLKDGELPPHENFTYLSFSEDKKVAYSFANPGPDGFGSLYDLGENGYVIKYTPKIEEVILHYKFIEMFPYIDVLANQGIDATTMSDQKEITILQPSLPFKNVIEFKDLK